MVLYGVAEIINIRACSPSHISLLDLTYFTPTSVFFFITKLCSHKIGSCSFTEGNFCTSTASRRSTRQQNFFHKHKTFFITFTAYFYHSLCTLPSVNKPPLQNLFFVEPMIRPRQGTTQWRDPIVVSHYVQYITNRSEWLQS